MSADFVLDPHQSFQQRFRPWRAPGDIYIHRNHQVDSLHHVIPILEVRATTHGARTHGDDILRIRHHVVKPPNATGHFVSNGSRYDHQIGLTRRCSESPSTKAVDIISTRSYSHHLDGTTSQAKCHW